MLFFKRRESQGFNPRQELPESDAYFNQVIETRCGYTPAQLKFAIMMNPDWLRTGSSKNPVFSIAKIMDKLILLLKIYLILENGKN